MLNRLSLKIFLKSEGRTTRKTKEIDRNAIFVVDFATLPTLRTYVNVAAAISIPALKTYAQVNITVNNDGARLEGLDKVATNRRGDQLLWTTIIKKLRGQLKLEQATAT